MARLLRLYEDDLTVRCSQRTVPTYMAHVAVFLDWLHARGLELIDVRTDDLLAYQSDLVAQRQKNGQPYSISHQGGRIIAVKSLFRFLCRGGYRLQDPAAAVDLPRQDRRLPRSILSVAEMRRLLGAVKGRSALALRDRALLETLYATGIRNSELTALTPYDVDTAERVLRVVLGKGGKDRNVPLTRTAAATIETYLSKGRPALVRQGKWLFVAEKGGRIQRAVLSRIIQRWAKMAGLKKRVTCHTFRHSVATHLLKHRADIRHIQALLGHRSLSTTQRYTQVALVDLRQVIARAHPRGR